MATGGIHFRILEDIARDLSGDVNFPTCLDAAMLVRNTLRDPLADLQLVVRAISTEPLISSKLLKLANSVSYNHPASPLPICSWQSPGSALKSCGRLRWLWQWTRCSSRRT